MTNAYKILVGKPEAKRSFGRPKRRFEDNIRMNVREIGWENVNWLSPAQDRDRWPDLMNTTKTLRLP
jgi:hypothetical protein